jgi:hypothetical protein|uniref:Calcineurin-like phosphoesterase n=1 Tax=viral metagenome TaxID=1070528 RepID=A0A6H1ZAX9_9ZZZZ
MTTEPLSRELALEAYRASQQYSTRVAAAEALGIPCTTFKSRLYKAKEMARQGLLGTDAVLPGFEISRISEGPRGTTVEQRQERSGGFNIPEGHAIKGVSAFLDADGRVIGQWVKTKEGERDPVYVADIIRKAFEGFTASAIEAPPPRADEDSLTVYPLIDWHVGLLAWAEETGENYDLTIAKDIILRSMGKVINASPPSKHCVVLGLGDLLHFDGYEPVTSRSRNFLDADGRYPKVLRTSVQMVIATIEMALARHENVLVRILPGNHDDQSAVAVSLALGLYYSSHDRVTVDDSPSRFWWHRFGSVFLGAVHGDRAKMKDLPLVMAHDRPQDWGNSTYRRIYTGHTHHERRLEEGGVVVTSMRSPVAKDAYHSFEKYRSGRSVYSETYRADGSEVAAIQFNL